MTGAIAVPAGASTLLVRTDTVNDLLSEDSESFSLTGTLSSLGNDYHDSATATILDNDDNHLPTGGETSASVDDEGLSHGIPGGTGDIVVTPDADANEATFSGTLPFNFGGDGAGSVTFAAMDGTTGHIGTEDVTYAWDSGTGVLTATVSGGERGGSDLFTVQVTDPLTGEYTVTLLDNVLHSEGGNENNAVADLTYTVTDANNDAATGTLTVTFDDDMPKAVNIDSTQHLSESNTNLMIILDDSGSMADWAL